MTLVATFMFHGGPILLGDLAISAEGADPIAPVHVPAVADAHKVQSDREGWSVVGLEQKLVLLSDDCAIGWAGDMEAAGAAIATLRSELARTRLSVEDILRLWSEHPSVRRYKASMVGFLRDGNHVAQFHSGGAELQLGSLGRAAVAGSGVPALYELDELAAEAQREESTNATPEWRALGLSLALTSMLLLSELQGGRSAPTLQQLFGGGYEVTYFSEGRFRKLGGFTHLIWTAEVREGRVYSIGPKLIVKQAYAGDWLVLLSAQMRVAPGGGSGQLAHVQRHVRPPMYPGASPSPEALEQVTFTSSVICHCFEIRVADRVVEVLTRIQAFGPDTAPPIVHADEEGNVGVTVDPSLWRDVVSWIEESLPDTPRVV